MTRIILNEALRRLLPDLSGRIVLCNEAGEVLGQFLPERSTAPQKEPPPLSDDEWKHRESEEPIHTTAEVIAYLESLA